MYDCTNMGFLVVILMFPGGAGGIAYVYFMSWRLRFGRGPALYLVMRLSALCSLFVAICRVGLPRRGCGRRRLRPSSPVVYGLHHLLVEVVPGASCGVWWSVLSMGGGRGVFLHFNPGPARRVLIPALNSLQHSIHHRRRRLPPRRSTTTRPPSSM